MSTGRQDVVHIIHYSYYSNKCFEEEGRGLESGVTAESWEVNNYKSFVFFIFCFFLDCLYSLSVNYLETTPKSSGKAPKMCLSVPSVESITAAV